jgi:multicomponent K+:H+ antiporter subunit E
MNRPASATPPPARRWLPHPAASVTLAVLWLVLAGEASVAQVLFAALVGLALPPLAARFSPGVARVASWPAVWRLVGLVAWDIVVANVAVARLILGDVRRIRPAFVEVPVDFDHPVATALFASIITMTPGTVSCDVDRERRRILVHVLDLGEPPEAAAAAMKSRYETPLKEIFGC